MSKKLYTSILPYGHYKPSCIYIAVYTSERKILPFSSFSTYIRREWQNWYLIHTQLNIFHRHHRLHTDIQFTLLQNVADRFQYLYV